MVFLVALFSAGLDSAKARAEGWPEARAKQSAPAKIEIVYIVPMSHNDIGFTAPPRTVAELAAHHADQALEFARQDPAYVWNFEVFWELEQWFDPQGQPGFPPRPATPSASTQPAPRPQAIQELLDLVRKGRFGIGAAYVNPHTSVMSAWALDQLFRIPTEWARRQGLTLDWAVINDVPGHPPDLPKFLAANGVRYLLLGVNQMLSKPLPAEVSNTPFWWEAPDGSRVLTWIAAKAGYIESFGEYCIDPDTARLFNHEEFTQTLPPEVMRRGPLEFMRYGMQKLVTEYRERKYPYDAVVLIHAFDNWDASAAGRLPAAVRLWNESGGEPRLVLSTPDKFFRHIESKYGPRLPVRRGGFGGQWEGNRNGAPNAMARARAYEDQLRKTGEPNLDEVRRLLVYWEHSFSLTLPWPGYFTHEQAVEHNKQQWQMVAHWPLPKLPVSRGEPVDLPEVDGDGVLRPNRLCLAGSTFMTWHDFKPLPAEALVESTAERLDSGVVRCRHRIDRRKLPDSATVIWAWKLSEAEATAPVTIQTATGTMRWPEDGLAGYVQSSWVALWGFEIGSTRFVPHGPFKFSRPSEHPVICFTRQ